MENVCSKELHTSSQQDNSNSDLSIAIQPAFLSDAIDGRPPKCVVDAFNEYKPKSSSEIINILVHLSMVENGFSLCTDDGSTLLPKSWKDIAATLKYSKPNILSPDLPNAEDSLDLTPKYVDFNCSIAIVTMGPMKLILASFIGQETEISVKIDTSQYIPEGLIDPKSLRRLSQFDCFIRNELLYPLRVAAHNILGLPAPWHLIGLPYDIILHVLKLLSPNDILNVGATCKSMKATCEDQRLWFRLFKRDFPSQIKSTDLVDTYIWKDCYKSSYLQRKHTQSQVLIERFAPHSQFDNYPYLPRIPHPLNPPRTYFDPPYGPPDINPYGPMPEIYPPGAGINPFGDPDGPYFGGELNPPRRPRNPYGRMGGPRIHFL